jgi:hypothetical protein
MNELHVFLPFRMAAWLNESAASLGDIFCFLSPGEAGYFCHKENEDRKGSARVPKSRGCRARGGLEHRADQLCALRALRALCALCGESFFQPSRRATGLGA